MFLFSCIALFITLMYGRETNDIYYTALLPIKKRDTVKSKCLLAVLAQLSQLLISIPFAVLRVCILPDGNIVGIEANLAYYGFGLVIFAAFNFVFLTQFFKTAYKVGKAFVLAAIPATVGVVAMEALAHLPGFAWLDSVSQEMLLRQMPILLIGVIVYVVGIVVTYRVAARHFEQVDL